MNSNTINAISYTDTSGSPYREIKGLMEYLCCGRNKAMQIGIESGAKKKIGRRVIYDLRKIDAYMETLDCNEVNQEESLPADENIIRQTKEARSEYNRQRDNIRNIGE